MATRITAAILLLSLARCSGLSCASLGRPVQQSPAKTPPLGGDGSARFSTSIDASKAKLVADVMRVGHKVRAENSQWEDLKKVDVSTFKRAREVKKWLERGEIILCFAKKDRLNNNNNEEEKEEEEQELVAYGRCHHGVEQEVAFVEPTIPRAFSSSNVAGTIINFADSWARKQKAKTLRLKNPFKQKVGLAEQFFAANAHASAI